MRKIYLFFFSILLVGFLLPNNAHAEKISYKWGKINYNAPYAGKILATKDNVLYKLNSKTNTLSQIRIIKKGNEYPVYTVINHKSLGVLYDLGNSQVVKKSDRLSFSTPTFAMKETVGKEKIWLRNPTFIFNSKGELVFNIKNFQEAVLLRTEKDPLFHGKLLLKIKINNAYYKVQDVNPDWLEKSYYTVNPFKTWHFDSQTWNLIKNEQVKVGMTNTQVWLSLGYPDEKNIYSAGTLEQWIYGDVLKGASIFYLKNGILIDWQKM